ncbi:MAG TPA: CDF family Co(II)/Ni(II) efflux transporter DmeF [Ramlibacter sp.]|nr:CDF family Co(II)/Ni(II) efflux transporter DmeF [Ramlibacter sp.]
MNGPDVSRWQHAHVFDAGSAVAERGTRTVMWITAVTMVVEIIAGWWFNSMALLADGWHMSSHAVAIGVSAAAYAAARRYAGDPRFSFGAWKIEVLGGFASAVFLLVIAALMVIGSLQRLIAPEPIQFREAIVVAVLGLAVNLVCALILGKAHDHDQGHHHHGGHSHGHAHAHAHAHPGEPPTVHNPAHADLNLRSAYLHVVTDAATSVLAIVALLGGWFYGWSWLDPAMGLVGSVLVAWWARGLIAETAAVLLDREMDHPVVAEIRDAVEAQDEFTRIADLHVWRVGKAAYACALTVVTRRADLGADDIRQRIAAHEEIVHSTIEVHRQGG